MNSPLKTWANQQRGVDPAPNAAVSASMHSPAPAQPAPTEGQLLTAMLTPDRAAWVSKDPRSLERPDNPPSWVDDEAAWEKAKAAVKPKWDDYEEPWAVVSHIYGSITGG